MSIEPQGYLVAVGGAEDKGTDLEKGIIDRNRLNFFELGILKRIVDLSAKKRASRIEVITTASMIPNEVYDNYQDAFNKLGCENVGHMNIRVREDALSEDNIERLKNCDIVMVSGGNQLRLSSIYGGTPLLDMCRERYFNEHFVIAGTSAGAMSMSGTMIYEGNAANAHLKGEVRITTGLGFVNNAIIDTHFDKRGRFNRLVQAVAAQPGAIGIGLGEDTGVIVHQGHQLEVIGMGSVIIIDGSKVDYTNIGDLEFGAPLSISNMTVHMMSAGDQYDLKKRTFLASTKVAHMENH